MMMVLASAGTSLALCEAICGSAEAPAHHASQVAIHAHGHTTQPSAPASAMERGSGCKTLAQVSLMRRRSTLGAQSQSASAPVPDGPGHFREAPVDFAQFSPIAGRHGPPVALSRVVPLRV